MNSIPKNTSYKTVILDYDGFSYESYPDIAESSISNIIVSISKSVISDKWSFPKSGKQFLWIDNLDYNDPGVGCDLVFALHKELC